MDTDLASGEYGRVSESYVLALQSASSRIVNFIWSYNKSGKKPDETSFFDELKQKLSDLPEGVVLERLENSLMIAFVAASKAEDQNPEKIKTLVNKGLFKLELPDLIVDLTKTFGQEKSVASALEFLSTNGHVDEEMRKKHRNLDFLCLLYEV